MRVAVAKSTGSHYNRFPVRENVTKQRPTGYLDHRGLYWRSIVPLLVFQAAVWGLAGVLAFLIVGPRLAQDYYGAHRAVRSTWAQLAPALALSAGAGFLLAGVGTALALRAYSRRLGEPLGEIDGVLRRLASGQVPPPPPPAKRPRPAEEAAAMLEPLRERLHMLQGISRGIEKASLELNYRAGGTKEIPRKDLLGLAGQLDALARELAETLRWFEK